MKYMVSVTPGPMPPSPEQFDAALAWIDEQLDDGVFDCVYGYLGGGGFAVSNRDSHSEILADMTDYPLYGMVTWDIQPLLEFKEGADLQRAKLAEAQAAMAG